MAKKPTIGDVARKIIEFIKTDRANLIPLHIFCNKFRDMVEFSDVVEYLGEYFVMRPLLSLFFNGDVIKQNELTKETDRFIDVLYLGECLTVDDQAIIDNYYCKVKTNFTKSEKREDFTIETFEEFLNLVNKARGDKNGIVFTPTEIIDFLVSSANYILQKDFGTTLNSDDVAICDPFTGIAPFVTKLSEFTDEKHFLNNVVCNELVLFSYWIASLNIENTFYKKYGRYEPFKNISLSDTFRVYEDNQAKGLKKNLGRIEFTSDNCKTSKTGGG